MACVIWGDSPERISRSVRKQSRNTWSHVWTGQWFSGHTKADSALFELVCQPGWLSSCLKRKKGTYSHITQVGLRSLGGFWHTWKFHSKWHLHYCCPEPVNCVHPRILYSVHHEFLSLSRVICNSKFLKYKGSPGIETISLRSMVGLSCIGKVAVKKVGVPILPIVANSANKRFITQLLVSQQKMQWTFHDVMNWMNAVP